MTKRRVTKLFAVVALATTTPAVAERANTRHGIDPWAETRPTATPTPTTPSQVQVQPEVLARSLLALFGISLPRTLANGSPACGNVASRLPPCEPPPTRGGH